MQHPVAFTVCLVIWILIGAYYLNHKRWLKRLHSKPPEEVLHILRQLPEGCQLTSYHWREDTEWEADIAIDDRRFRLSSDYGRICESEIINGEVRSLPAKGYLQDTFFPKTLVEGLIEASKLPGPK